MDDIIQSNVIAHLDVRAVAALGSTCRGVSSQVESVLAVSRPIRFGRARLYEHQMKLIDFLNAPDLAPIKLVLNTRPNFGARTAVLKWALDRINRFSWPGHRKFRGGGNARGAIIHVVCDELAFAKWERVIKQHVPSTGPNRYIYDGRAVRIVYGYNTLYVSKIPSKEVLGSPYYCNQAYVFDIQNAGAMEHQAHLAYGVQTIFLRSNAHATFWVELYGGTYYLE
jgi:hypothetical protein